MPMISSNVFNVYLKNIILYTPVSPIMVDLGDSHGTCFKIQ